MYGLNTLTFKEKLANLIPKFLPHLFVLLSSLNDYVSHASIPETHLPLQAGHISSIPSASSREVACCVKHCSGHQKLANLGQHVASLQAPKLSSSQLDDTRQLFFLQNSKGKYNIQKR
ncbi:hypothetical protein GQR58_024513 [Nymphon striatum]|nr:hypothetical protein GQR58_024513 [Nymphon striatum]